MQHDRRDHRWRHLPDRMHGCVHRTQHRVRPPSTRCALCAPPRARLPPRTLGLPSPSVPCGRCAPSDAPGGWNETAGGPWSQLMWEVAPTWGDLSDPREDVTVEGYVTWLTLSNHLVDRCPWAGKAGHPPTPPSSALLGHLLLLARHSGYWVIPLWSLLAGTSRSL